jgi:hypothetical protein
MVKRALNLQVKMIDLEEKQENIFHLRCHVQNKICRMIININNCTNIASTNLVDKLNLYTTKHFISYKLQ